MSNEYRPGLVVRPYERLDKEQIEHLHRASLSILEDPGIWCYNRRAAELFGSAGAQVSEVTEHDQPVWRVSFPAGLVEEQISNAPSEFVLGARAPENRLHLDADTPRVYFGSGSETNVWLETRMETFESREDPGSTATIPRFTELRGSSALLCRAAKLCDQLDRKSVV